MLKTALVGFGYWGAKLARNFQNLETFNLMSIVDLNPKNLASAKKEIFEFFDNVIVNDENEFIKKNRLELLQMLCKAFDNYIDFSSIGSL